MRTLIFIERHDDAKYILGSTICHTNDRARVVVVLLAGQYTQVSLSPTHFGWHLGRKNRVRSKLSASESRTHWHTGSTHTVRVHYQITGKMIPKDRPTGHIGAIYCEHRPHCFGHTNHFTKIQTFEYSATHLSLDHLPNTRQIVQSKQLNYHDDIFLCLN